MGAGADVLLTLAKGNIAFMRRHPVTVTRGWWFDRDRSARSSSWF